MNHFSNNKKKANKQHDSIFYIRPNHFYQCFLYCFFISLNMLYILRLLSALFPFKCIEILLGKCTKHYVCHKKGVLHKGLQQVYSDLSSSVFQRIYKTLMYLRPIRDLNCLFPYPNTLALSRSAFLTVQGNADTLKCPSLNIELSIGLYRIRPERKRAVISQ